MKSGLALAVCALLFVAASGDHYLHMFPGSNNKLNDENNNTQNEQRLFDSQNNNNGGYHWGPKLSYYAGTMVSVEFTTQHSCGLANNHCELILQYMCDDTLRDGNAAAGANGRQTYDPNQGDQAGGNADRGRHETGQWYLDCLARERNKGLFTADQGMQDNIGATSTRQDTGGTQHGTECPEERDYYPYWHPTPWKDLHIYTGNVSRCEYYQLESGNVMDKGICDDAQYNNQADCQDNGGTWNVGGSHGMDPPPCNLSPYMRDNQNGNGMHGYHNWANFTMPDTPHENCVLRSRYNISTTDSVEGLAFWDLDYKYNGGNSPVQGNPELDLGLAAKLKLALNTDQYGRTFEDRSHSFEIKAAIPEMAECAGTIWNLNVRGRRGNIQQCYPAVEYDFSPQRLNIETGGCVHIQWTGSNYNAADQAGEGTDQTDRHNLCQTKGNKLDVNFPEHKDDVTMFVDEELMKGLAHLGGTDNKLNDAPESWDAGIVQFNTEGEFHYMCTRNNNFTNRGQKATLIVGTSLGTGAAAAIGIGVALLLLGGAVAGVALYARSNPQSAVGQLFGRSSSMGGSYGSRSYGGYTQASHGSRNSYGSRGSKGSRGSRGSRGSKSRKSKKSRSRSHGSRSRSHGSRSR